MKRFGGQSINRGGLMGKRVEIERQAQWEDLQRDSSHPR